MEEFMVKQGFSEEEIYGFLNDMELPTMRNMFVTPKNVDETVRQMCHTIVEALNGSIIG
jgi:spore protease